MAVKTVVINKSDRALKLKEGNGGVYRSLKTLEPRTGKYTITCNTDATFREYWVGTGTESEADTVLTITSDDCVEYQTIFIVNDSENPARLKLDNVIRGVQELAVVNQTTDPVNVIKIDGAETHVLKELQKDEKFVIKSDREEAKRSGPQYSVLAGGKTIPISTREVAKAQRIYISKADTATPGQAPKLDMVPRRLSLTEVTNKTGAAITVKYHPRGNSSPGVEVKTLQLDESFTIGYDPKQGRRYSVEYYSSTPAAAAGTSPPVFFPPTYFAEYEKIDILSRGTELELERLDPRAYVGISKDGFMSRLWRGFALWR